MENSTSSEEWENFYEVRPIREFRSTGFGVFCKNTGKRYGQGESSRGKAVRKARRCYKLMLEKVDRIILIG